MGLRRRTFTALAGTAWLTGLARAQERPLKILVGYAPGGAADTVARAVADGLREAGYAALVENKAGAAGRLASEALLAAPADGATLVLMPLGNLTLLPHVTRGLRFDPLKDFAAVAPASSMGFALAVGAGSPARTLQQFLALARKEPGMAAYGTPGPGTAMHFLGQMLARDAKLSLTHVAYKGGAAAVTDAIGGTLPAVITTTPNLVPMHRAGKLRILAVSDAAPLAALPGVPTFKAAGHPDLTVSETFALFARAGTAPATIAQLNQAITAAVRQPRIAALLEKAEYEVETGTPEALEARVRAEHASWARVVKATGYTPDE